MRTLAPVCLLVVLAGAWSALGGERKKFEDPTPRKEAILKLFSEEFIKITPGEGKYLAEFMMGSDKKPEEQPVHKVTLKKPLAVGKYEVTQELWHVVMGGNPSKWQGPRNSVEMITWPEAKEFCRRATVELRKRKLIGEDEEVRLPSEAEWEYFARAGTTTAWSFGDDVKEIGRFSWYKVNAPGNDPPVGKKDPNPWGLYDIHGYISEWCLDNWHPNYKGAPADGSAWVDDFPVDYVIRGGSFADEPDVQRSAARQRLSPTTRSDRVGFRCVLVRKT